VQLEDVFKDSGSLQILEDLPAPPKLIEINSDDEEEPQEDPVEE